MRIEIRDNGDLQKLSKDLRKYADGKRLRQQFVKDVRAEVRPLQNQVKAAYRAQPGWSGRRTRPGGSLRGMLAKAVTTTARVSGKLAGVTLRVDGKKMPSSMRRLPKLYEGNVSWRHPVFGNKSAAVNQDATPTFTRLVPRLGRPVQKRVEKLADEIARKIARR